MLKGSIMRDRLIRGVLSGLIACLWIEAWNNVSYYLLHFAKVTWTQSLNQLVMGHSINSTMDFIVSHALLFFWNGFLGAIYVRSIIPERDGNYILRGIFFGLAAWFAIYSLGTLYKIPTLDVVAWQTALSNWITVTMWGIIVGWLTGRWDDLEAEKREAK